MELRILRGSTKPKLPKLRELGDLDEVSKKGGNQETQSTATQRKKKKMGRATVRKDREVEDRKRKRERVKSPSFQITNPPKKPGARYTKTFSAEPNASHGANDAPPPRAAWLYMCGTQVGHRRGCTLQSNLRKREGKRIKKAICREIIKMKTRATCTRARGGKGASRREKKGRRREKENGTAHDRMREGRTEKER